MRVSGVLAIVVVGAMRHHAHADAPRAPDEASDTREANETREASDTRETRETDDAALVHLDRGIAAFDAKDFATAHRELSIAHELAPSKANPYRWLALTEIQVGDCVSALPHIDGFLSRVPTGDARIPEMTRWREFCTRSSDPLPPPKPVDKPLHARWWFWPVVGTAALAITGATVIVLTQSNESTLPPVRFP
jgi:hypothetical protein